MGNKTKEQIKKEWEEYKKTDEYKNWKRVDRMWLTVVGVKNIYDEFFGLRFDTKKVFPLFFLEIYYDIDEKGVQQILERYCSKDFFKVMPKGGVNPREFKCEKREDDLIVHYRVRKNNE